MASPVPTVDPTGAPVASAPSGPRRSSWVIVLLVAAVLLLSGIIGYSLYGGLSNSDDDGRRPQAIVDSTLSAPVRASDPPVQ